MWALHVSWFRSKQETPKLREKGSNIKLSPVCKWVPGCHLESPNVVAVTALAMNFDSSQLCSWTELSKPGATHLRTPAVSPFSVSGHLPWLQSVVQLCSCKCEGRQISPGMCEIVLYLTVTAFSRLVLGSLLWQAEKGKRTESLEF